jgi:hypothetical protein
MNKIKHLPTSLPKTNGTFSLSEFEGTTTGHKYSGSFACQIPNNRIAAKISKSKALLNAGLDSSLDIFTKNLHHMVSYCKHTLTEAPDWFTESEYGYDLYDFNVLEEIYFQILKKEEEWYTSIWGKKEEE